MQAVAVEATAAALRVDTVAAVAAAVVIAREVVDTPEAAGTPEGANFVVRRR